MVFQPPARENIRLLRAILQKLAETPDNELGDLAYLRRLILKRIAELEAAQTIESSKAKGPAIHRPAA